MTRTIEKLLRELAALLKQSTALKMHGHELSKTPDQLRHKAEGLKDDADPKKGANPQGE